MLFSTISGCFRTSSLPETVNSTSMLGKLRASIKAGSHRIKAVSKPKATRNIKKYPATAALETLKVHGPAKGEGAPPPKGDAPVPPGRKASDAQAQTFGGRIDADKLGVVDSDIFVIFVIFDVSVTRYPLASSH